MNRRELAAGAVLGLAGLGVSGAAGAQPMREPGGPGPAERRHAMETARVGAVSLATSQLAQSSARGPGVLQFAKFEVAEQTTIAQIIQEMTGMAPPPPPPEAQAMMDRLRTARGRQFEMEYVRGQVDGHQQLLSIQERYLAEGQDPHHRHIAMLARGQIKEHLDLLGNLKRMS